MIRPDNVSPVGQEGDAPRQHAGSCFTWVWARDWPCAELEDHAERIICGRTEGAMGLHWTDSRFLQLAMVGDMLSSRAAFGSGYGWILLVCVTFDDFFPLEALEGCLSRWLVSHGLQGWVSLNLGYESYGPWAMIGRTQ